MTNITFDKTIFLTWVYSAGQRKRVRLLIDSLRSFGGTLNECPVWVFEANPDKAPCKELEDEAVQILPLEVPNSVKHYLYADKVYACARAEAMVDATVQSLVWLTPECLLIQPPDLFALPSDLSTAVRPVHIQNVGLIASDPVDEFWKKVYEVVGVRDIRTTVESFIDVKSIRAYYNSAAFAFDPSFGLCSRWFEFFETLVCDQEFQETACQDERHQIFLHQAILSSLIVTMFEPENIRILPPEYVYPYNLHYDVLLDRRAKVLNDLVCIYYEGRSLRLDEIRDIEVLEPLRSWLAALQITE